MGVVSHSPIVSGHDLRWSSAEDSTDRIISWLLSPEVQVREGAEAGGVLGWSDARPDGKFIYCEITGYYLTFLAFLAETTRTNGLLGPRIRAAASWIGRNWKPGAKPLTRPYLDGRNDRDWRNGFHFSFDLAMMLRGLSAVAGFLDTAVYSSILDSLIFRLHQFVDASGLLQPCVALHGGSRPVRWCAEAGPYQLKAAASILPLSGTVPAALSTAAQKTVDRWEGFLPDSVSCEELHPFLYFVEGLVLLGCQHSDPERLRRAAAAYCRVFAPAASSDVRWTGDRARSDVIAQTLRLGLILRQFGYLRSPHWGLFLDALADRLLAFRGPTGAIYFRRDALGQLVHANTWSSLFAVQALRLHNASREGSFVDLAAVRFLV